MRSAPTCSAGTVRQADFRRCPHLAAGNRRGRQGTPSDLLATQPSIPSRQIARMRDRLAHRHFDTALTQTGCSAKARRHRRFGSSDRLVAWPWIEVTLGPVALPSGYRWRRGRALAWLLRLNLGSPGDLEPSAPRSSAASLRPQAARVGAGLECADAAAMGSRGHGMPPATQRSQNEEPNPAS